MIGRRAALAAAGWLAARQAIAALPVPPGDVLAFRLLRHGSEIGRHVLKFDRQSDALTVRITVDALVTLLSIPIVRYAHRATETWQDQSLVGLNSETDKNGQHEWMNASRSDQGLVVLGSRAARYVAPPTALATSYWNRRMLDGPMISMEDGVLLHPKVAERPEEPVRLASGAAVQARHYTLAGAFAADVWYDLANTWASFAVDVADGSTVHYERL
jgi:Family of unknown function (DUF6134)